MERRFAAVRQFELFGSKVLARLLLERVLGRPFVRFGIPACRVAGGLITTALLTAIGMGIAVLARVDAVHAIPTVLVASLIASLSLYVQAWAYEYAHARLRDIERAQAASPVVDGILARSMDGMFSLKWQILVPAISLVLISALVWCAQANGGLPFQANAATGFAMVIVALAVGQGGYWAVATPLILRDIRPRHSSELAMHPLYPASASFLVNISRIFAAFSVWDGILVTCCLMGLAALGPNLRQSSVAYFVALIIFGYAITGWTFLYPQWKLSLLVQSAKSETLAVLDAKIQDLYRQLGEAGKCDFDVLTNLMSLRDKVDQSSNAVVGAHARRSVVGSLLLQTVTGILGLLSSVLR